MRVVHVDRPVPVTASVRYSVGGEVFVQCRWTGRVACDSKLKRIFPAPNALYGVELWSSKGQSKSTESGSGAAATGL